jgi:hypothetical protein
MSFVWGAGDCAEVKPAAHELLVTVSEVTDPGLTFWETGTGSATSDALSYRVSNSDVHDDGGSTQRLTTWTAMVDDAGKITGMGSEVFSGVWQCSQQFAVTGKVESK